MRSILPQQTTTQIGMQNKKIADKHQTVDIVSRIKHSDNDRVMRLVYGEEDVTGTEHELLSLIEKTYSNEQKPILYQSCGTEDFLYEDNIRFKELCEKTNYQLTTDFGPGEHE
ncbi:hypothetical protein [Halalkalibacter lacteus]|uniref:hypothetical protein n=1 Tax=Halalkalibacter lacteus TaxID=3090663 RepID=UPI002FC8493E